MKEDMPRWLTALNEEDLQFLKRFLVVSGSLKALAAQYGISYPTVRVRLDRLISKVKAADEPSLTDPFRRQLELLLADGRLDSGAARQLLEAHNQTAQQRRRKT